MSGWVRNEAPGQPGWFIAGYDADPGWLVTDADIKRLGREGVAGLTVGLPPLPAEVWQLPEEHYHHATDGPPGRRNAPPCGCDTPCQPWRPVICPRCKRQAVGWPLRRADVCSPKDWVACIRDPFRIVETLRG